MRKNTLARFRAFIEANPGPHVCQCGCGGPITLVVDHMFHSRVPRFLKGHRRVSGPPNERFWRYVTRGDGCWPWTGAKTQGYGVLGIGRRLVRAHRFSYELHVGPIPEGVEVCHNCPGGKDNPSCVNPAHLFLGAHADNMRDAGVKGQMARGNGHPHARLTEAAVLEIRRRYTAGNVTQQELADEYGVHAGTIGGIVRYKEWRHVGQSDVSPSV